jgi:hypothetical protein
LVKIIQTIQNWFQKLSAAQKQRFVLICTGVFVFLLTLSVLLSLVNNAPERPERIETEPERLIFNLPIPAGELFLPDEPDFVPGIILQRDRRTTWTEEDAAEFWQDPLRIGEEQWRENIEAAIDKLLERIP